MGWLFLLQACVDSWAGKPMVSSTYANCVYITSVGRIAMLPGSWVAGAGHQMAAPPPNAAVAFPAARQFSQGKLLAHATEPAGRDINT